MEIFTTDEWAILDWLISSPADRQRLTGYELGFVEDCHARGPAAIVTRKQRALVRELGSKFPPGPQLHSACLAALSNLKDARTPEDLRDRLSEALRLRCQLMHATTDPEMIPVVAHNLAENLYYTLRKELPLCSSR